MEGNVAPQVRQGRGPTQLAQLIDVQQVERVIRVVVARVDRAHRLVGREIALLTEPEILRAAEQCRSNDAATTELA